MGRANIIFRNRWLTGLALASLLLVGFVQGVTAITKGYHTSDTNLKPGLVVSIDTSRGDDTWVTIANREETSNLVGIVTTVEDSFIAITSSERSLYVESEGEVEAYVSDLNGEVVSGDLLTLSPISGVLMKASSTDAVMGVALENFNDKPSETYPVESLGSGKETKLSRIKINFNLQAFLNNQLAGDDSALRRLGRSVVGKEIGELRLIVALLILVVVLIVEGSIIYGAVSSSLIALGRNPMAKTIIKKELFRVLLVTILVLGLGVGAIYTILWV